MKNRETFKKPTLWKAGLAILIFALVGLVAAIVGGEDSSAVMFGSDFPVSAQIAACVVVGALGVLFMVRNSKEDK